MLVSNNYVKFTGTLPQQSLAKSEKPSLTFKGTLTSDRFEKTVSFAGLEREGTPEGKSVLFDEKIPLLHVAMGKSYSDVAKNPTTMEELEKSLVESLSDKDPDVRLNAVKALDNMDDSEVIHLGAATPLLFDDDPRVKRAFTEYVENRLSRSYISEIKNLGQSGNDEAFNKLVKYLVTTTDLKVRKAAVDALISMNGLDATQTSVTALARLRELVKEGNNDANEVIKRLGYSGPDDGTLKLLCDQYKD